MCRPGQLRCPVCRMDWPHRDGDDLLFPWSVSRPQLTLGVTGSRRQVIDADVLMDSTVSAQSDSEMPPVQEQPRPRDFDTPTVCLARIADPISTPQIMHICSNVVVRPDRNRTSASSSSSSSAASAVGAQTPSNWVHVDPICISDDD
jgi:hypothetical protein